MKHLKVASQDTTLSVTKYKYQESHIHYSIQLFIIYGYYLLIYLKNMIQSTGVGEC